MQDDILTRHDCISEFGSQHTEFDKPRILLDQLQKQMLACGLKYEQVFQRDELGLPSFWQLQLLGWTAFCFVLLVSVLPYRKAEEFLNETIACAAMFLASCLLRPVCRSLLRRSLPWISLELRGLVWSVAVGTVAAFITELAILRMVRLVWTDLLINILQISVVLFLWCTLYFSIKQWQQSARERERLLIAEREARDARLSALRYQLHPHFLFNSLNAVSTMVLKGDAPGATRMLSQIGSLLRASLDGRFVSEISLSQELDFAKKYLAIEQTRLGDRLQVAFDIAPDSLDASVPSMLLQPLLENAVRHGVGRLRHGGLIAIQAAVENNRLRILVRNSGPPRSADAVSGEARGGIGLANTTERLKRVYGPACEFALRWPEYGGCELTIQAPFKRIAERVEEVTCAR
jgi:two-component system, LytTR family, sensor kinase